MFEKGLIVIVLLLLLVSENISLLWMKSVLFFEVFLMILWKKLLRSNEDNLLWRLIFFFGIWGEDCFFIISVGSSVRNGKEKYILVEEELE